MQRTASVSRSRLLIPAFVALTAIVIFAPTVAIGADDPSCGNSTAQVTTTPPAPAVDATASASQVDPATDTSDLAPGMRIFIDPETGQIGVPSVLPALTPEELAEIQPLQPPVETVMPDGSVMLELNGNCQDYFMIQLDANGQAVTRCVQDPKTVLETTPTAPQREDR